MKMWVDDVRDPPASFDTWETGDRTKGFCIVRSSGQAIACLESFRESGIEMEAISLDHDLGGEDTTRPIVLWMIEHNYWPKRIYVHTSNPVGREWLEGMINRYRP